MATTVDLARILTEAAPFAHEDTTLPMINGVLLESTATHLIATATNQFILGSSAAEHTGKAKQWSLFLPLAQVKTLAKIARGAGEHGTVDLAHIKPKPGALRAYFSTGEDVTLPAADIRFIDWRKLLPASTDSTDILGDDISPTITVNPQYMAKFGRIKRVDGSGGMQVVWRDPKRSVVVRIGADFVGIIMPVRNEETGWRLPAWASDAPDSDAASSKRAI